MLIVIGLIMDCLGVAIIMLHTLYDLGMEAALRIFNDKQQGKQKVEAFQSYR